MSLHGFFLIIVCAAIPFCGVAQQTDSTHQTTADSVNIDEPQVEMVKEKKPHSPKVATILSAAMPGLGQIYNRKYWKLPIVYGALGGLIYSAIWNNDNHQTFRNAYIIRIDDDPTTTDQFVGQYSKENLKQIQATYKRNRDISFIFIGVFYALNIIDAAVDAHLYDFDVSEDLSLSVRPVINPIQYSNATSMGVGVSLRLR